MHAHEDHAHLRTAMPLTCAPLRSHLAKAKNYPLGGSSLFDRVVPTTDKHYLNNTMQKSYMLLQFKATHLAYDSYYDYNSSKFPWIEAVYNYPHIIDKPVQPSLVS